MKTIPAGIEWTTRRNGEHVCTIRSEPETVYEWSELITMLVPNGQLAAQWNGPSGYGYCSCCGQSRHGGSPLSGGAFNGLFGGLFT